jgi:hypothetical protein
MAGLDAWNKKTLFEGNPFFGTDVHPLKVIIN